MPGNRFLLNVVLKALVLFVLANLAFAAWPEALPALGQISAYNHLFPGRERFPFGEDPAHAYNLSLYNLNAMLASHELAGAVRSPSEFRIFVVGDSSIWGTLLRPEQTLAGQLNAAGLSLCGRKVRVFNLGYPTLSLAKDLMILDLVRQYRPDLILWPVTLESFVPEQQLASPIVANNPEAVRQLIARYSLPLNPDDPALVTPGFWGRTILGQRRALADLFRLQAYGILWASTGIDQYYPAQYIPAQRDLENDPTFHNRPPGTLAPGKDLSLDLLDAGVRVASPAPVWVINEPILISAGKNSAVRYNFYYPRWAYDQYRQILAQHSQQAGWKYLDAWNLIPEAEFTNSAIHLSPPGSAQFAGYVAGQLRQMSCP